MSNDSKLLLGLVIGASVGAIAGLLLAPDSGEKTRKKIKDASQTFKDDLNNKLHQVSEKLDDETIDELKHQFKNISGKAKEKYDDIAKSISTLEQEIEEKITAIKKRATELNIE